MFVRRKYNKSGSISVHVVDKSRGGYKVLKVFGPAMTAQEADLLENKARQYMLEQTGRMESLFAETGEDIINDVLPGLQEGQVQVAGPELIFGGLYDRLGYGALKDEMFRHLVICRLFDPGSKLRAIGYLKQYLGKDYTKGQIYRYLDNLSVKPQVEKVSFKYARQKGDLGGVFFVITALQYDSATEEELHLAGFKKVGRPRCPQMFLGMLVSADGHPVCYEVYDKNVFNGSTLIPAIEKVTSRHRFPRPTVVADAGLLSKESVKILGDQGYKYIVGTRPRSGRDTEGLIVTKVDGLVAKDVQNREEDLARLRKKLAGRKLSKANLNNRGSNRFLKLEGRRRIVIDMEKVEAEAAWDGIRAFMTTPGLETGDVMSACGILGSAGQAFCMNKVDLKVRPLNGELQSRIEGHVCICFAAYAVFVQMDKILRESGSGLTLERVREVVRTMYRLNYVSSATKRRMSVLLQLAGEQRQIYELVCPEE